MFRCVLFLAILGTSTSALFAFTHLNPQAQSDFTWFSQLGFPDVKDSPFVRVVTGRYYQDPPQNQCFNAFLLHASSRDFTVIGMDLRIQRFTISSNGTPAYRRIGFEPIDLRAESHASLSGRTNMSNLYWHLTDNPQVGGEKFFLAWACWRKGLVSEAQQLYDEIDQGRSYHDTGHKPESTFPVWLETHITYLLMQRARTDFGDPSISRRQLLARFENIVTNYPQSTNLESATHIAAVLRRMVAEDASHTIKTPVELSRLTTNEQVTELIFQLRDQSGQQLFRSHNIFQYSPRTTNSPADQLVRFGYSAVPQLITVLDSDTFLRAVYSGNFDSSPLILAVADYADAILQRITGRSFLNEIPASYDMPRAQAARKEAEAWWSEFQQKGEKQMLINDTLAGSWDASRLLMERFPDIAASTLITGFQKYTNETKRADFVRELVSLNCESNLTILKDEMVNGPFRASRLAAAEGVNWYDHALAETSMIREWQNYRLQKPDEEDRWTGLIEFLQGCYSTNAIAALAHDFRKLPPATKLDVMEVLGEMDSPVTYLEHRDKPALPASIETLLVSELDDTEERVGLGGSMNGISFCDPRICDIAGYFLTKCWPARYNFDLSAPIHTRDRQRLIAMNTWRSAHGQQLLPLPAVPSVHVPRNQSTEVISITWTSDLSPPAKWSDRISLLHDHLLTTDEVIGLLTQFVQHPATNASGMDLQFVRDDDLTGVSLVVKLLPRNSPGRDWWDTRQRVVQGRKILHSSQAGAVTSIFSQPKGWKDLSNALSTVLTAPPDVPFEISVKLTSAQ